MFGIFQADLPIGRGIWLVALALIATSLVTGVSPNMPSDPVAFAIAMIVYTAHSYVVGFMISLIPTLLTSVLEVPTLLRRSEALGPTAILFVDFRYEHVRRALGNVAVAGAAVHAAPRFGDEALRVTGLFGVAVLLLIELIDLGSFFRGFRTLVEIKAEGNAKSSARVFASGKLFREIQLTNDAAHVIAQLFDAGWEFIREPVSVSENSAWLRKNISERRLRLISTAAEGYVTLDAISAQFKRFWMRVLAVLFLLAGLIEVVAGGYLLILTLGFEANHVPLHVGLMDRRFRVVGAIAVSAMLMLFASMALIRWSAGRSILTGKSKSRVDDTPGPDAIGQLDEAAPSAERSRPRKRRRRRRRVAGRGPTPTQ